MSSSSFQEEDTEVPMTEQINEEDISLYEHTHAGQELNKLKPRDKQYQCIECHKYIVGFQYTCVQCTDWDFCGACEARGAHQDHYVLRVPSPGPHKNIQAILAVIREQLRSENLFLPEKTSVVRVKQEPEVDPENASPASDPLDQGHANTSEHYSPQCKRFRQSSDTELRTSVILTKEISNNIYPKKLRPPKNIPDNVNLEQINIESVDSCSTQNLTDETMNLAVKIKHEPAEISHSSPLQETIVERIEEAKNLAVNMKQEPSQISHSSPLQETIVERSEEAKNLAVNIKQEPTEISHSSPLQETIVKRIEEAKNLAVNMKQEPTRISHSSPLQETIVERSEEAKNLAVNIKQEPTEYASTEYNSIVIEETRVERNEEREAVNIKMPPDTEDAALVQALISKAFVAMQSLRVEEQQIIIKDEKNLKST